MMADRICVQHLSVFAVGGSELFVDLWCLLSETGSRFLVVRCETWFRLGSSSHTVKVERLIRDYSWPSKTCSDSIFRTCSYLRGMVTMFRSANQYTTNK